MWHDSIIAGVGGGGVGGGGVGGGGVGGGGDGDGTLETPSAVTLETPSAVMRTTLPSNLERRNELCSALSATVCKFCCR